LLFVQPLLSPELPFGTLFYERPTGVYESQCGCVIGKRYTSANRFSIGIGCRKVNASFGITAHSVVKMSETEEIDDDAVSAIFACRDSERTSIIVTNEVTCKRFIGR
jgi:hypothetical protein